MTIALPDKTKKLLRQQMKKGGFATAEEALHSALQAFAELQGKPIESLDKGTQAALNRAFAQSERGEGRAWSEVRGEILNRYPRKK